MASLTSLPIVYKISNRIIRILGCNPGPMTLQGTNTYLIGTGARRALIDAGDAGDTSSNYTKALYDVLSKENASIEHLIITHWHHDHIGGVPTIQEMLMTKMPGHNPPTVWKLPRSLKDQENAPFVDASVKWQSLTDGQIVEVEGAKLQVMHTPGHTTDHACLFLKDEQILFSGDCILGEATSVFEDLYDYMISLHKILNTNPTIICPGHGILLKNPIPQIQFYIEHRQKREMEILKVLEEHGNITSISEMDIVKIIYDKTPENLWPAAASNVFHHLKKLLKERKVVGEKGKWYIAKTSL